MNKRLIAKLYLVLVAIALVLLGWLVPDLGILMVLFFGMGFLLLSIIVSFLIITGQL